MNNPQAHSQGENTLAAGSPHFGSTIAPATQGSVTGRRRRHRVFTELFSGNAAVGRLPRTRDLRHAG